MLSEYRDTENIKIVIVEDDMIVREGLRMLIEGSPGFTCLASFSNGEEAVKEIPELRDWYHLHTIRNGFGYVC